MRARYGSNLGHLIGHVLAFALMGYALLQILGIGSTGNVIVWLVGAILLHDAVLWPLYSGASTSGTRLFGGAVNYVRIPAGLSLTLALVFVATLTGKGEGVYERISNDTWHGMAGRWLIVTLVMFLISGAVYLVRRFRT